jgi:hypothetical protein
MPSDPQINTGRRPTRSNWAFVVFLLGFMILLIGVCYYFLLPAYAARKTATPPDRAKLRAYSALIMSLLLVTLVCGLILTFRIGRFFFPRPTQPRTRTPYVDIWKEAGKRLEAPIDEGDDGKIED